jgi:hypothetical protein
VFPGDHVLVLIEEEEDIIHEVSLKNGEHFKAHQNTTVL